MKRFILIVWACYAYTFMSYGQTLTFTGGVNDPAAAIQFALSDIDQSPVTSHVLLDRTLPMGRVTDYGLSTASDSTYCNMSLLDLQFTSLLSASLPSYPVTSDLLDYKADYETYNPDGTVPLVLMAMDYHRFKPSAVDDGILTISGGKLQHGSGYTAADAYELKSAYHSGFFTNDWGYSTDISLSSNHLLGNLDINTSSIYLDASLINSKVIVNPTYL